MGRCTTPWCSTLCQRRVCAGVLAEPRRCLSHTHAPVLAPMKLVPRQATGVRQMPAPMEASQAPPMPDARAWNTTRDWCSLCCEPVNVWNDHRGKREHICLEMFYNALVQADRRWDPAEVWADVEADAEFCLSGGRWTSPRRAARHQPEPVRTLARADTPSPLPCIDALAQRLDTSPRSPHYSPGGGFYANPIIAFQRAFERGEPVARRVELVQTLRYLMDRRVLVLTPANLHNASFEGSLVLFRELFSPLSNLFPLASAKEVSGLTQMVAATYNSETVFDLCHLEQLVSPEIAASRSVLESGANVVGGSAEEEAMTMDGELSHVDAGGDGGADAVGGEREGDGRVLSLPFFFKGVFCRAILGALRWSLALDSVEPPPALLRGPRADKEFYAVLAAHACRLLIAEVLHCKVSEYVIRVEGVFREEASGGLAEAAPYRFANCDVYDPLASGRDAARAGMRLVRRPHGRTRERVRSEVVPTPMHWGMLQYCNGGDPFHGLRAAPNAARPAIV